MLKTTSQEFRKFFLLEFTKQLIHTFVPEEIVKVDVMVKEGGKERKQEIKEQIREVLKAPKLITPRTIPIRQQIRKAFKPLPRPLISPRRIQAPRFPPRLQYLRPIPKEIQIDLGKLNSIIKDPTVISIECDGPGKNIIVRNPSQRSTSTILTKEDIEVIIQEFSEVSKIPVQKGIYKVAAGKLILLAVVSDVVGTRFIIKKIPPTQQIIPR